MAPLLSSATSIPQTVFKKLNALANKQWEESLQFNAFHIWFLHNELPGSAAWALAHSDEERKTALKLFAHLADRRIEEEGKGAGAGGWTTTGEQQPVVAEPPPHQSKTFEWTTQPNVYLDLKPAMATKFSDPIHIWKVALERKRAMSKEYFECLQLAKKSNDFVTENLVLHELIPKPFTENALEEILENAMLVTKRGPELYFELDSKMPSKPH